MPVSVVSIYYIERRNDESRLLPDLSYVMVKVYFEFSRQMTYLVSTLFNNKFVVVCSSSSGSSRSSSSISTSLCYCCYFCSKIIGKMRDIGSELEIFLVRPREWRV